ncbi:LysR family transcriptional regulator [Neomegalonema sp.]|uniref:LysR family transcriptional regulator n=1 Tax=Neomegalonema sp. TaxID=2039713 RepID=UPI00260319B2|nr:LysR family transcriptional regulator [Neomegalonema sp.]MDD2867760.1 LysR family transcriptional regulator [Neomegalonema sp.]
MNKIRKTPNPLAEALALLREPAADLSSGSPKSAARRVGGDITMRKLQIFWAVAHAGSLTRAAKTLEVTQPTLSQQLAALEASVGARLFERAGGALTLTEFGVSFRRHVESVLRTTQELEDMISESGEGRQRTIRIAGLPSAMRTLAPAAMLSLASERAALDFDMHEGAPDEILEMLYARRINVALLSSNMLDDLSTGFRQIPLMEDPYVLVTPERLDLSEISDPESQLSPEDREILRRTIQFAFGNQHSRRIQNWFDAVLPGARTFARTRSFDLAVEMVRSGLGICVAPRLSASQGQGSATLEGVRLHQLSIAPRRIVAITPTHYARQEPYATLLARLQEVGAGLSWPPVAPQPPFIALRQQDQRR